MKSDFSNLKLGGAIVVLLLPSLVNAQEQADTTLWLIPLLIQILKRL